MIRFNALCGGLLALVLLVTLPALAGAQTTLNPTTVEFVPSADHDRLGLDGQPMVTRYELRIFAQGATVPRVTQDIGKPTPVAGKIAVTNPGYFLTLITNTLYTAKVVAIGPSGEAVSEDSNPFGNQGPPAAATSVVVRR